MTYNNGFNPTKYSNRKIHTYQKRNANAFLEFILILFSALIRTMKKESIVMGVRVTISLSCLAGVFSVVHFVEAGVLGVFGAIVISLALLGLVTFCFAGEE